METRSGLPRIFDVAAAALGLIVLAPVCGVVALLVGFSSGRPVLFRQQRAGRRGELFELYKFRTMRVAAAGPHVTADDDARITTVGKWLRRTKLDELPELWNVLKGDMAFVGPRPEAVAYVDLNNPQWRHVLTARPGLTDPVTLALRNEQEVLAQVKGSREQFYLDVLQPFKLQGYVEYLGRRSWQSDLHVLGATLLAVVVPTRTPPPSIDEISAAGIRR